MPVKVREILDRLASDGLYIDRTRGSHRVLKHSTKRGIVVVAGKSSKDIAPGTLKSILRQSELEDEL